MKTSHAGIDLIKHFEGCRLSSYLDGANIATIGYGHTRNVQLGQAISQDQADALLASDLSTFEKCVSDSVYVPLTQGMFDSLVSFTFNLGGGNLARSTLLKKLNAGDLEGCRREFSKWDMSDGVHVPGLLTRRMAEANMFANAAPIAAIPDAPLLPSVIPTKTVGLAASIINLLACLFRK